MAQTIDLRSRRGNGSTNGGGREQAGRVPPHNLQAEESLIGAMLLSRDAIGPAVESCSASDFYKPAHAHIFEAITSLWSRGEPADPVTVADELARADLLDAIGGSSTLISLQANTPATSNAARYARIIEEHALLRRLISTAGEIAEMGYSLPEDVTSVVDHAESMMFDVAQRRVADTTQPIRELLSQSLDRLEALYDRGESITGVPTGFNDLDERLSGLQPSALLIIGARPAMGKALALDTPIPTAQGWKVMGELTIGDRVFDEHGVLCDVTYVSPVYDQRQCYEVQFDDGTKIVADAEHQWSVYDYCAWELSCEAAHKAEERMLPLPKAAPPMVRTTQQLLQTGVVTKDMCPNWYIPVAGALDLVDIDLPVDPYVFGSSLGDRAITQLDQADLRHFEIQYELAGHVFSEQPTNAIESMVDSAGRHIPSMFLRSSAKQRLALLQGLMDVYGSVLDDGQSVELCLADRRLLDEARELICSLGVKASKVRQKLVPLSGGAIGQAWRISWTPLDPVFRMERKVQSLNLPNTYRPSGRHSRRAIISIKPVSSVPVQCIQVNSPNHLYLASESLIPTHNTSFALNLVSNAALSGAPVLFFSLEMSHLEITQRLLCAEARVDASRLRNGKLHDTDWPKINNAIARLGEAPIFIDDNPMCTVMDIRAKARRLKATPGGLGMIVVDYLQLMSGRANAESRQVEVSEMSRGLKILARELSVPVIALSQLSRNLENRADKRPVLADLRESGSLEQDADVVMFLYRDEVYSPDSPDKGTAEVIVSKHRNGPVGTTTLAFIDRYTRFANMARV